ncbi:hypothetical protein SDC9_119118 [bioreactor metagenome]|uniref:NAD-specific glutamate dehydrogenase n=1 Tax=bioreactor metagenome TaxID=1076179 RepID=A0A645C3M6_9ZZZZ
MAHLVDQTLDRLAHVLHRRHQADTVATLQLDLAAQVAGGNLVRHLGREVRLATQLAQQVAGDEEAQEGNRRQRQQDDDKGQGGGAVAGRGSFGGGLLGQLVVVVEMLVHHLVDLTGDGGVLLEQFAGLFVLVLARQFEDGLDAGDELGKERLFLFVNGPIAVVGNRRRICFQGIFRQFQAFLDRLLDVCHLGRVRVHDVAIDADAQAGEIRPDRIQRGHTGHGIDRGVVGGVEHLAHLLVVERGQQQDAEQRGASKQDHFLGDGEFHESLRFRNGGVSCWWSRDWPLNRQRPGG